MATRYYPTVAVPNARIHGPAQGTWAPEGVFGASWNPVQWTWRMGRTKTDTFQTAQTMRTNQQGDFDFLLARWMTPVLSAQSITGTFDLCFGSVVIWNDSGGDSDDTIAQYKLHIYLADGQTHIVKTVLLDNYVDATDLPLNSVGNTWQSLTSAQTLASATAADGDVIVVELGFRIESSPTPSPAYPPDATSRIVLQAIGARSSYADAVAGDTSTSRAAWFEFSMDLTEAALPAAPANDACADAIDITGLLPYSLEDLDTSQSADTERGVWWTFTAPSTGVVNVTTFGSNYLTTINIFRGSCAGLIAVAGNTDIQAAAHRSLTTNIFTATIGTQYWIRIRNSIDVTNAINSGGICNIQVRYRDTTPQEDDLYLPAGLVCAIRDGAVINYTPVWRTSNPTGVSIDYTHRVMDDLNGGTNATDRLYLGLHDFEIVEILKLSDLSYAVPLPSEIDLIEDPWNVPGVSIHPAQNHFTAAGVLHQGWFGNGYLYVMGTGTRPAILNTVSDNTAYSALKSIDGTEADNQAGAPFTDTVRVITPQVTAAWAITVNEDTGILYFTSGGLYIPVGGTEIGSYNLNTNTQLGAFATLSLQSGVNPGLKGLQVLADGSMLVCNSTVVHWLSSTGTIQRTYTPSIEDDSQCLIDVKLTADGTAFWTVDLATTRLFKFDILTGDELETVQPYLLPGTLVQMAIYQPEGAEPPPEIEPEIEAISEMDCIRPGLQTLIITGSNFSDGLEVLITDPNGDPVTTTSVTFTNSTSVTVQFVAQTFGEYCFRVQNPGALLPSSEFCITATCDETAVMRRLRRVPVLSSENVWLIYKQFVLDYEAGVGLTTGQGEDPKFLIHWSDDGGHTWTQWHEEKMGRIGEYQHRVMLRRLGRSRKRIFEIVCSEPVKAVLIDGYVDVEKGTS